MIEGGGKLVIWGRDDSRLNIDAVLSAGVPCTVECEYRPPAPAQAEKFGHTHWVPAGARLRLIAD